MATALKERLARQASGELHLNFDVAGHDEPRLVNLPLDCIEPDPEQPRQDLGDLAELADSIREQGLIQPLIVEPIDHARYRIVAGERRHAACQVAGLQTAPCLVRTVEEHSRLALQLMENLHRKALAPLEEAKAFRRLLEEFNLTQRELAKRLGKSVASVNETLRLLEFTPDLMSRVRTSEQVPKSVLLEIAKEPDPHQQALMLEQAQAGGLTVRTARQRNQPQNERAAPRPGKASTVHTIVLTHATVTVQFHEGEGSNADVVGVLEEALARKRPSIW